MRAAKPALKTLMKIIPLLLALFIAALPAAAQDAPRPITYDDVNEVAARMYCPECENVPLDKCFTPVCIQWKQDIADQLSAGVSEEAVIAGFVARFGDQVVGVPQDPLLRNLALVVPVVLLLACAVFGVYVIYQKRRPAAADTDAPAPSPDERADRRYIARLEQDMDES